MARRLTLVVTLVIAVGTPAWAAMDYAAAPTAQTQTQQGLATVKVGDRIVIQVAPAGSLSAEERAKAVRGAIVSVLTPPTGQTTVRAFNLPDDVTVGVAEGQNIVLFKGKSIVTVTPPDTAAAGKSADALAEQWAQDLRDALAALNIDERTAFSAVRDKVAVGAAAPARTGRSGDDADSRIAARIRDRLRYDKRLSQETITVDVRRGDVTVRGTVHDRQTADRILDAVRNTEGVNHVRSDLRIQGQ